MVDIWILCAKVQICGGKSVLLLYANSKQRHVKQDELDFISLCIQSFLLIDQIMLELTIGLSETFRKVFSIIYYQLSIDIACKQHFRFSITHTCNNIIFLVHVTLLYRLR